MSLAKQEFTNAGRAMLGRAQNGETLTITKIVVGQGSALTAEDLWPLTDLIDPELEVTISVKQDYGNGTLLVEGSFLSTEAGQAFWLREVGVMAHIGSEADALYSVANVLTDPPDYIDPAAPTVQAFKIKLVIDRIPTVNLVVQIGPSENVVGENVGVATVGPGWYKTATGNILYFKRAEAGPGIELIEDVGETKVTIRTKQLIQNVDLYVPENHPNAPNPDVAFPTIQEAHDYLLGFTIPPDKFATIHVYTGTHLVAPPGIVFSHPNSRQINLYGEPRVDKTSTGILYVDATHKDVAANNSGIVVGQRVYLAACGPGWAGGCKVTELRPPYIRCDVYRRGAQPPWSVNDTATNPNRRLSYFPTVVVFNGTPTSGQYLFYCPYGIGLVQNMCFDGGWYCVCPSVAGGFQNVMVMNSKRGFSLGTGEFGFGQDVVMCDCDWGVIGGTLQAYDQTYINGCGNGVSPSAAGIALGSIQVGMPDSVVYINNCQYGIAASGGRLIGGSMFYFSCDFGMSAGNMATLSIGAAYPSYPSNNGTDLHANQMSFIEYDRWGATVPTCDPTAEVVGNLNSLIHVKNSS